LWRSGKSGTFAAGNFKQMKHYRKIIVNSGLKVGEDSQRCGSSFFCEQFETLFVFINKRNGKKMFFRRRPLPVCSPDSLGSGFGLQ
jgi:hypothetical protein